MVRTHLLRRRARPGGPRPVAGLRAGLPRTLPVLALLVTASLLSGCLSRPSGNLQPSLTPLLLPTQVVASALEDRSDSASTALATASAAPRQQRASETASRIEQTSTAAVSQGTVTITPAVAARLLALGIRPALALYASPGAAAAQVLPGSEVLWAEGRSSDGRWLLVTYGGEGSAGGPATAAGWVARGDVTLFGDEAALPVATPGARVVGAGTPAPTGGGMRGRVVGERLNVRGGPGVDQPVLGQVVRDDAVTVLGRTEDGEWLNIAWQDRAAWVAARYVEVAGNPASLPAVGHSSSRVPAPGPALPGKIAFQTRSGGDIYVVKADGSGWRSGTGALQRVAAGLDPVLSPDGTRLAYARWEAPAGIYVLDLQSGEERRVVGANRPRGPTWSPDGARLAFDYSMRSYVCRVSPWGCLEDQALRQLLGGECADTPFGHYCIGDFPSQMVDEYGLVQVNLADGAWQDFPAQKTAQSPQWHPQRDEILYRGDKGLQITSLAGNTRPFLADPDLGSPAWSPDGQQIAVQRRLHDHFDLFILDAAGNIQRRLTTPPDPFVRAPDNVAPAWSPDGRYILFLSNRDGSWRLYLMNADGSNQALLLPAALGVIKLNYDFAAERMASWAP
jgi:hypothetical protein